MQITDEVIEIRRINYVCCAMSYMSKYLDGLKYGDASCSNNRNLWLYMLWAKSVADRTPLSTEDEGCVSYETAEAVFEKADCLCSSCGCPPEDGTSDFPPTDSCEPVIDFNVLAAVDVSQRVAIEAAGPIIGDRYIVVNDTGGTGWVINTIVVWNGTGWTQTSIVNGQIAQTAIGDLWTTLDGIQPGLLYPTVTMTFFAPGQYIFQSDYPQVSQFAGRTAMVEILTPGGWVMLFQGPEAALASPQVYSMSGFSFTSVRVTYVLGDCSWTSENGNIEPPGCVFPGAHDCDAHDIDSHF
jgi:hypothetical protein